MSIELAGCARQAEPGVAEHHPGLGGALDEEGEAVARDLDHRRIDLEEGPAWSAARSRTGAAAEADDADPRMAPNSVSALVSARPTPERRA
jgi:hypothetical protein